MAFDPNDTQPTKKYIEEPTRNPDEANDPNKKLDKLTTRDYDFPISENTKPTQISLKFGLGSFLFLLGLLWISDWLGAAFPGPVDDIIYDLLGALFFGLIQQLRSYFANKKYNPPT